MTKLKKAILILPLLILLMSFTITENWYQLDTTEFKMLFPKSPENTTQKATAEAGEIVINTYMLNASKDKNEENLFYAIASSEYPKEHIESHKEYDNLKTLFNNTIGGMVNKVNGKLISEKNIEFNGFQGREIKIDFKNGYAIINARIYQINYKIYIMETISKKENDNNKSTEKFLNSFSLKK